MLVRPSTPSDADAVWPIFHQVIAPGDTYVFPSDMTWNEAMAYWYQSGTHTYVAEHDGRVVGTYILKPNQPGRGSHVANAAFMVCPSARGLGVGRRMGEHSIAEARRLGFRAMQLNFVVSTNTPALRLWESLGFQIVGTLPAAFHHPTAGYVDAYVMYLTLDAET